MNISNGWYLFGIALRELFFLLLKLVILIYFIIFIFFTGGIQCPSLWVGTSLGTVGLIALSLPTLEQRKSQAVLSNCTGKIQTVQIISKNVDLILTSFLVISSASIVPASGVSNTCLNHITPAIWGQNCMQIDCYWQSLTNKLYSFNAVLVNDNWKIAIKLNYK